MAFMPWEAILGFLFASILAGFFLFNTGLHRAFFYVAIPIGIILLREEDARAIVSSIFKDKLFIVSVLYMLLNVASLLWSKNDDLEEYWGAFKIAPFILVFYCMLTCLLAKRPDFTRWYGISYITTGAITAIILLIENFSSIESLYLSSGTASIWRLEAFGRGRNENLAGVIYGVAALLSIYGRIYFLRNWVGRATYSVTAILFSSIVLLTLSRGALVALVGTLAIISAINILIAKRQSPLPLITLIIGVIGIALSFLFAFPEIVNYMVDRGSTGRMQIWSQALDYIKSSPLMGQGAAGKIHFDVSFGDDRLITYNHTHNIYLGTLVKTGIVGFALFMSILFVALRRSLSLIVLHGNYIPFALLVFGSIFGLVDFGGYYVNLGTEWLVFWIPIIYLTWHAVPPSARAANTVVVSYN